jgi:hypothetical protein
MSQSENPSRHTNLNKSVNAAPAENQGSERDGFTSRVEEAVGEFAATFPDRAAVPIAQGDGVRIRRDYANIEREEWTEDQPDQPEFEVKEAASGTEVADVSGVSWGDAVREFCQSHAKTEETTVNLEYGYPGGETFDTFQINAENRWMASYQERYYAQTEGWLRELTGGSRPSGGETAATFEEPKVALLTRSASSVPDGDRMSPVDHAQALRDAWEPTYHTLRNRMRSLGLTLGEDWQYVRVLEPHTSKRGDGRGTNSAYAHEHTIVVVDGDVTAGDFRPVVEKHVEECDPAGADAHGEEAIEIRDPDDLNDVAAYIADYASIEPKSLWDRSADYIGWAAAMTAGNVRTVTRSETARAAAQADACRQRAESPEAEQSARHGENVRRGASGDAVCAECGSSHAIEAETLTAARTDGPAACDGGAVTAPQYAYTDEALRSAWPSADAASAGGQRVGEEDGEPWRYGEPEGRERVRREIEKADGSVGRIAGFLGMPPDRVGRYLREIQADYEPGVGRSFDVTVPRWYVDSVTVEGEERPASSGSGIEMVEVRDVEERLMGELEPGQRYRCECGTAAYGRTMAAHVHGHGIEEPEIAAEVVEEEV